MKILIASDLFVPVLNGVSIFSRNLAHGLAEKGHEVIVIAPSQTGRKYKEIDRNYTIYRTRSVVFPFYQNIRMSSTPQLEIRKIIQRFQPDIVHIQMPLPIGQGVMLWARRYGIPVVTTSHAMPENLLENLKRLSLSSLSRPINYLLSDYGRRFHNQADVITAPTKSGLEGFDHRHIDKLTKPIRVISNGINLQEYSPGVAPAELYEKFHLPTDKPIVTYIGRVDAEKHLSVLIDAFARVRKATDAHLLVVGDGVDRGNLEALVEEAGMSSCATFTGRVSDEDKIQLEHVGSVYVMPSPVELQSIATLEAMASGQPVVAVDAGALAELCHEGKNGYLFDLDNDEQCAAGILEIITKPAVREQFSKESMKIAKTHDINHVLDTFVALYEETIRSKQKELAERPERLIDRIREYDLLERHKAKEDTAINDRSR